ncbi:MAG: hypothetical protein ACYDCL_10720 [Myxococcales bacterium]
MKTTSIATALLWLCACGQPVADGSYKGQPLVSFHGTVQTAGQAVTATHPYIGLVWEEMPPPPTTPSSAPSSGASFVPQFFGELTPISATSFPATFDFDVFDPPPPQAMMTLPSSAGGGSFGAAAIVAIDDVNGDGQFQLTTSEVSYDCPDSATNGCNAPVGYLALDSSCTLGSGQTGESCTAQVISIAAPDRLLGGANAALFYVPSGGGIPSGLQASLINGQLLAQPGFYLFGPCDLQPTNPTYGQYPGTPSCGGVPQASCSGPQPVVAVEVEGDSTPVNVVLDGTWGLVDEQIQPSQLPLCP